MTKKALRKKQRRKRKKERMNNQQENQEIVLKFGNHLAKFKISSSLLKRQEMNLPRHLLHNYIKGVEESDDENSIKFTPIGRFAVRDGVRYEIWEGK